MKFKQLANILRSGTALSENRCRSCYLERENHPRKKDADYTYTFGGTNNITTENGKKSVATAILKNIKTGNAKNNKLADGIVAYEDDIVAALQVKTYLLDNTLTFSTYKSYRNAMAECKSER